VRDFILEHKDEPITIGMVCDRFGVRPVMAVRLMLPYQDRDMVRFVVRDDHSVWMYVPPPKDHPTHRPRHSPHPSRQMTGAAEIAYTGQPMGSTGKPGRDKKNKLRGKARKGRRGVK
jgi:hypothetical protein